MDAGTDAFFASLRARAREVGAELEPRLTSLDETEAARLALRALADAGLTQFSVPHAFGGADVHATCERTKVGVRALCALRDELTWHSGMLDVMLVMQGLGSFPIAAGGSAALRDEYLPAVARGERIAAFALTEPDAGSSLDDVATRAERVGERWILRGAKTFISNAGIADFYSVLARTSGEPGTRGGQTMFCVPAHARGVSVARFEVLGPHPIGDVRFDAVELDDAQRLGEVGRGQELALGTLARFRTSVAAAADGFARRALDESKARLRARTQFGKPLSTFQALRFDLAEMDVRLRASQLLVDEAALLVDLERPAQAAVARAKLFATESAGWICDRAVQHFGGLGVKRGSVVERLYRDVRALRIYEGTSEIQKLVLAKEILGEPMAKFRHHIFVCVNERSKDDKRGDCAGKGGHDVASAFKKQLAERGYKRIVRPNKAQCLDQCELGCAVVIYPEQVWYGHVKPSDVEEIIESHIVNGRPVERLRIKDADLSGRESGGEA